MFYIILFIKFDGQVTFLRWKKLWGWGLENPRQQQFNTLEIPVANVDSDLVIYPIGLI